MSRKMTNKIARKIVFPVLVASIVLTGCDGGSASLADDAAFRVRADFSAPLNTDTGWAQELNQNATVMADHPFRLRFEVGGMAAAHDELGLEYRRNGGEWSVVEAHDFPYPSRKHEVDFSDAAAGSTPADWRAVVGSASNIAVAADDDRQVLSARADDTILIALYPPPWKLDEFSLATKLRLSAGDVSAAGLTFGYVDADNHWRVMLNANQGSIRVIRRIDGTDTIVTEQSAGVIAGEWLEFEAKVEAGKLEINFQDDALVLIETVGNSVPQSDLGFYVPAGAQADFSEFVIEGQPKSPRVSIVSTEAYDNGAPTEDLLAGNTQKFMPGAGVSLSERVSAAQESSSHSEYEWPLVIRYFADDAVNNETGDTFEFRMIGASGEAVSRGSYPVLTLEVPAGHLGGTFVETAGRIGPWQASNGDLYFIMEPAESDNRFMMVKSTDGGQSWREVGGANRPATGDLESVDGRMVDGTIHIVHQVSEATFHHAFRTSDHPTHPDTWAITDELATRVNARSQMASLVVRSDGSMVAFHLGDTIGYVVRSPYGEWSEETVIDYGNGAPDLAGPQAVLGANDTVHLAYYRMDGTIWYRSLLADGTLTVAQQLATGVGTSEDDWGSVLPLVYLPSSDTVVIIYRLLDGTLWERRIAGDNLPSAAVQVTNRNVVQSAVDSQQAAADAVADGDSVRVLFIDEDSRSVHSTHDIGGWQAPTLEVDGIEGTWVRGSVYVRPDGVKVYGYVYDAGSKGGAGFNRFRERSLQH